TGGVRIYGNDHFVLNNYFQDLTGQLWDAPITLTNGDYDSGTSYSKHFRINRAIITNNTLINNYRGIEIGFTNNGKYNKPPRDVMMLNNLVVGDSSDLISVHTNPENMTWANNMMYPTGVEVGIEADSNEIAVLDPVLELIDGIYRLTASSPAIDRGTATERLTHDIDGQARDVNPDIGADEYRSATFHRLPLTPGDVGPDSFDPLDIRRTYAGQPSEVSLGFKNYPNPFNPVTTIRFDLSKADDVSLIIYDITGRHVAGLVTAYVRAGKHQVQWNGHGYPSGIYIAQLVTPEYAKSIKMVLLK
ncbi:T9SS type A sorting domain-containing protein, partial [Candidatus Neomarinimicrobiota bacterium]